jgi:hypothetical protein
MRAQPSGMAQTRPPERTRTLVVCLGSIWVWPGIALSMRRGGEIVPVAAETIRFWITQLHGPDALYKELMPAWPGPLRI